MRELVPAGYSRKFMQTMLERKLVKFKNPVYRPTDAGIQAIAAIEVGGPGPDDPDAEQKEVYGDDDKE